MLIYSFLYFKEETNAFHYQKVAIFLYRKSVERECRWKGEERNQALFQNLNSETCKQNLQQRWLPANIQELLPETSTPWVVSGFFQKDRRNQGTSRASFQFFTIGGSYRTGEHEKPRFDDASEEELKQLVEASVPVNTKKATLSE